MLKIRYLSEIMLDNFNSIKIRRLFLKKYGKYRDIKLKNNRFE